MYRLVGLGDYPPTAGQCWSPPGSIKPGWNPAAAFATCTYAPPAGTTLPGGGVAPAVAIPVGGSSPWYTTWWGVGLLAAVGFVGYQYLVKK